MPTPSVNKETATQILDTNFHERTIDFNGWKRLFPIEAAAVEASISEIASLAWNACAKHLYQIQYEAPVIAPDKETFLTNLFPDAK